MLRLSTTDRAVFKRCRRLWDFTSPLRQGLEPKLPPTTLWLGSGIHRGLQAYYNPETFLDAKAAENAFRVWLKQETDKLQTGIDSVSSSPTMIFVTEDYSSIAKLGEEILRYYCRQSQKGLDNELKKSLGSEVKATTIIGGWIEYAAVADAVVQTKDNKVWLMEHKTASKLSDHEPMLLDEQCSAELLVFEHLSPVGVLFTVIRKAVPAVPKLVKDGSRLNKQVKLESTDYDTYLGAIREYGLKEEDYAEELRILQHAANKFVTRIKVTRNQAQLKSITERIKLEAEDMASNPRIYPNFSFMCLRTCSFRDVCLAMESGDDWEFLLNTYYQKKKDQ